MHYYLIREKHDIHAAKNSKRKWTNSKAVLTILRYFEKKVEM